MDELLWVIWKHDPLEWVLVCDEVREVVIRRCGDSHHTLLATALKPNDDVFLEYVVILECITA